MIDSEADHDLSRLMHELGDSAQPPTERLIAGGLSRGRTRARRHTVVRRTAMAVSVAAAVALGGVTAPLIVDAFRPPILATPAGTAPGGTTAGATAPPPGGPSPSDSYDSALPVRLELAGWTCQEPIDPEKTVCSNGTAQVSVVWRSADGYSSWKTEFDSGGRRISMLGSTGFLYDHPGIGAVGKPKHGGFVTVTAARGATLDDVEAVATSLVWR